jgi:hypothetical protein
MPHENEITRPDSLYEIEEALGLAQSVHDGRA